MRSIYRWPLANIEKPKGIYIDGRSLIALGQAILYGNYSAGGQFVVMPSA